MANRTYILCDSYDGRTIKILNRVSSRALARKAAVQFGRSWYDSFDLIELRDGGERLHVQRYQGAVSRAKSPLTGIGGAA